MVVSFPLRVTPLVKLAKEIVQSGKLGSIKHVQAVNNVPYGGVYYHSWYRVTVKEIKVCELEV